MTENVGINLEKHLSSKGPLPGPQVVRLAWQLAKVMEEESESETSTRIPVLHVGRIIITSSGKIDVTPTDETDLGLPIVASFPHHASPEEIGGEAGDFRSSLYSLGCTLFQIATGELPYTGDSPKDILKAHLKEDVPNPTDKCAGISEELARAIQELLRKNPEQRIQNVPEFLRRLKICLNAETSSGGRAPPAPAKKENPDSEEDFVEGEEKKAPPLPKIKLPSKTSGSEKAPGKSSEKKAGKPGTRAGRKIPSFSKKKSDDRPSKMVTVSKKSDDRPSKMATVSKKSFSFSKKTKLSESRKSPGGDRKSRLAEAGPKLSGKLIDHGDDGDIFEDSFEEEQLAYPVTRKKARPFMMAGAALGVVIAVIVVFWTRKESKEQAFENQEMFAEKASKQLEEIKTGWRTKYDKEKKSLEDYLTRQTHRFNAGESPIVIEGAIEGQLETSMFNKPGAANLAVLYAQVHARAEEIRAARTETELGSTEGNFESFVSSFNRLYDQGLWAPAMDKIREAESRYNATKAKEIDELFFKAEKEMMTQWEADELKIKGLADEGEPQEAVQVAEAAKLYGDGQIQKNAAQYIQSIRSQTIISSAESKETEEKPEKPAEGGIPDDLEAELKGLDDRR